MKIHAHRNLRDPQVIRASRVVLTTDDGTPLAFAIELQDGTIVLETIKERNQVEFNNMLKQLGIGDTAVVVKDVPADGPLRVEI